MSYKTWYIRYYNYIEISTRTFNIRGKINTYSSIYVWSNSWLTYWYGDSDTLLFVLVTQIEEPVVPSIQWDESGSGFTTPGLNFHLRRLFLNFIRFPTSFFGKKSFKSSSRYLSWPNNILKSKKNLIMRNTKERSKKAYHCRLYVNMVVRLDIFPLSIEVNHH